MLPELIPIEWLDWLGPGAAGFVVLLLSSSILVAHPPSARSSTGGGPRDRARACRAFVDAVTRGDFDAAEAIATFAFAPARPRRDRNTARTSRHVRRLIEGSQRNVLTWDERRLLTLPIEDVRRQFMDPNARAMWFPDIVRVSEHGHVDLIFGRADPVRLRLISETWTPELDGLSFTAACPTVQIDGFISLRTVVSATGSSGGMPGAVEVWIHMEGIGSTTGRQSVARARRIARMGLDRMAAELKPS